MRARHRGLKPLLRLAALVLVAGCRSPTDATLARLVECAQATEDGLNAAPAARLAFVGQGESCGHEVFAGCEAVELAEADALAQRAAATGVPVIALACLQRYCERFTAAPTLCSEPAILGRPDVAAARRAAESFIAAKLALDLAVDRGDPRLATIARPFARLWAVEAMHAELNASPPP